MFYDNQRIKLRSVIYDMQTLKLEPRHSGNCPHGKCPYAGKVERYRTDVSKTGPMMKSGYSVQ